MSAWQDIFSFENWEIITGIKPVIDHGEQKSYIICAAMPNGKNAEISKELINSITKLIKLYHEIPKMEISRIDDRIKTLAEIQTLTYKYLASRGEDLQLKKDKKLNLLSKNPSSIFIKNPIKKTPLFNFLSKNENKNLSSSDHSSISSSSYSSLNSSSSSLDLVYQTTPTRRTATFENDLELPELKIDNLTTEQTSNQALLNYKNHGLGSMDQWIMSLHRRITKKITQLTQLKNSPLLSKDCLIEQIKQKHQEGKLYPGCLLEKLDLFHRQSEFDPLLIHNELLQGLDGIASNTFSSAIPMNNAYAEYVKSKVTVPFEMFLEDNSITKSHRILDEDYQKIKTIDYQPKDTLIVTISSNNIDKKNRLMARKKYALENDKNPLTLLNTQQTISGNLNSCIKLFSEPNATAFVWSLEDTAIFYTHPHLEGKYHHSSLVEGKDVRAAGMWHTIEGKIKYISNSSGHYRTSSLQFHQLIHFLHKKGLIDEDTVICDLNENVISNMKKSLQQYYNWASLYVLDSTASTFSRK